MGAGWSFALSQIAGPKNCLINFGYSSGSAMKIPVLLVLAVLNSGCAVHNHYYPASVADHPDGIDKPIEAEQSN